MPIRTSRLLTFLFVCCACVGAVASVSTDPGGLLSKLPSTAHQNVLILDGQLKRMKGITHWRISLNDSIVFTSEKSASNSEIKLRVALVLRPGDNLITIDGVEADAASSSPTRRWSTHVFRESEKKAEQFALLVQGDIINPTDASHLPEFRSALVGAGIDPSHIMTALSASDVEKDLSSLGSKTDINDQVLIYYSGIGQLSKANTEPLLVFPRGETQFNTVRASDLIHQSADLPSTSVLLDMAYAPPQSGIDQPSDRVPVAASSQSAPWLQSLSSLSNVELAYTSPYGAGTGGPIGGFTADLIAELATPTTEPLPCRTFADVVQAATTGARKQVAARTVYFTQNPTSSSFCFSKPMGESQLISAELSQVKADPAFTVANLHIKIPGSMNATWADVIVDGVPVRHRAVPPTPGGNQSAGLIQRVPLDPGKHLVEIKAGRGNSVAHLGSEVVTVPGSISLQSHGSSRLRASMLEPIGLDNVTSDSSVSVSFVVGDLDGNPVEYEMRNNGVCIHRDIVHRISLLQRVEVVRSVPLAIGANSIVVEVKHADRFSAATSTIVRRPAQPVRAVIVGVDAPKGLPPLNGAVADARLIRDVVSRYTEALPNQIILLTGLSATREAITTAIANSTNSHPTDPATDPEGSDETLLVYFAGYGRSVKDPDTSQVTRCILPADFDPNQPEKTCLPTTEIDNLLDSSPKAVVIVDTSYDGLSGQQKVAFGGAGNVTSRTAMDFFAGDTTWRLSAGTDRPDRVFLVASGTNSPALEFGILGHGLFTLALVDSITNQLVSSSNRVTTATTVSLFDVYNRARVATLSKSNNQQDPVMKGVLSTQFQFAAKSPLDLKREAKALSRAVRDDIVSMRSVNPVQIKRGRNLYSKILSVSENDVEALQGQARLLLYQGELSTAAQLIDKSMASAPTPPDPKDDAEWLSIRSELKMRKGDLQGAIDDCKQSLERNPDSLRSSAQLGMLYAATLQYDKSFQVLQGVLDKYPSVVSEHTFTEEEWGELVLLAYLGLRRSGSSGDATLLLRSYSESYAGFNALKHLFSDSFVFRKLLPRENHLVSTGDVSVQSPWSHVVSQFMLSPKKHEWDLRSFWGSTAGYDPKNEKQFNCMLHFYLGMERLLEKSTDEAKREFEAAVETGQSEYAEYWMSRSEAQLLDKRSNRDEVSTTFDQVASR